MTPLDWRKHVRSHLPPLAASAERESEIVEELAIQLESIYERARAAGASEEDAMTRAAAEVPDWHALARTLGRIERPHQPAPLAGAPAGGIMAGIGSDIRFAVRSLTRTPSFTAISLLTLALGLGLGAAAFSVLDTVLIKPLPFPSPDRLVLVHATVPPNGRETDEITYLDANDLGRELRVFASAGVAIPYAATLSSFDPPERIEGLEISPSLFDTLGVQPMLGRSFTAAEGQTGPPNVVILGHGFWRRLGSRAAIIGETLTLDDVPHTIVGVMPEGFDLGVLNQPDNIYRPVTPRHFAAANRGFRAFRAIAKLQPDVSIEQAQSVATAVGARLAAEYPETNRGRAFSLHPLHEVIVAPVRPALYLIAGLVAAVLLIAGVNLANLLLARALARAREVAVRSALGAGAWRLARTSLTEAAVLAAVGAMAAGFVAQVIVAAVVATPGIALPRIDEIALTRREIAALGAAAALTAVAVAGIPFLMRRRLHDTAALRTSHETASRTEARLRSALVSAQTALAFLLLAVAVLLTVSLQRVLSVPPGFDAGVVTMRIAAPAPRYPTRDATARFFSTLVDDVRAQPGVHAAGFVSTLPLSGNTGSTLTVQGREHVPMAERPEVGWQWASPGYFEAMGIPVIHGRGFASADLAGSQHVTLINETFARLHFPGEDPLGKRVYFGGYPAGGVPEWHEIVGVVGDVRHRSLEATPDARAYDLFGQHWGRTISLALRTSESGPAAAAMVRAVLSRQDPRLAVFAVRTTDDIIDTTVATRRLMLWLVRAFAAAGFGVALLGVYGIVACLVAERQREIGVRVALGATAANIERLVIGHGVKLVAAGLAAGAVAAIGLRRTVESQLFGIEATNPAVLTTVALALLMAAVVPCFIVARRATRLDPVRILRAE
jgi:predicted permease